MDQRAGAVVVTVTPNPSLDLTYLLGDGDALSRDDLEVHRAQWVTLEASGKGVNVTRTLVAAGGASVAVFPAGGATGAHLVDLLQRDGVAHRAVPVAGDTRVNTTVLAAGLPTAKLNGPGSPLSAAEVQALLDAVDSTLATAAGSAAWLAVCGSLPPGSPATLVAGLVRMAHARGVRCAVDTSGEPLAMALEAGADLLAPNVAELAAVSPEVAALLSAGRDAPGPALVEAARGVAARRGCELLVSLGRAGALWTDGRHAVHDAGTPVVPVNTAGAGDALLAGWLAGGDDPAGRLARAVGWGRAACLSPTTVALQTSPGMPPGRARDTV